jgi:hypothetical protein
MTKLHYGNEHIEGIAANHSDMVKFSGPTDATYESVQFRLKGMGRRQNSEGNDGGT